MRRSCLALVAAALAVACTGPQHTAPSRAGGRVVGGGFAAIGGVLIVVGATKNCTRSDFGAALDCGLGAGLAEAFGAVLVATGLTMVVYNELRTVRPEAPVTPPPPPPIVDEIRRIPGGDRLPDPPTRDGRLHQLTLQASLAARAGQCSAVRVIAEHVGDLDAPYRRRGFVADPAIAGCL